MSYQVYLIKEKKKLKEKRLTGLHLKLFPSKTAYGFK